jgi:ABC-type glycerol-3-phosphate transport system substrate-binding protein
MNGTAGMAALGTHRLKTIQASNPDVQWAPLPTFPGEKDASVITGWTLGIGRSSDHPEEAAKFIKFMTSPEAQARLARGGEVPARKSAAADPYFNSAEGKLIKDFAQYIATAGQIRKYPATWGQLAQSMAEGMQSLYLKGTAAEETMDNIVETYNQNRSTS